MRPSRLLFVALGSGRIDLDPPDAVEAGQLELFTGGARLDQEFQEAVLVVGLDAAVNGMLKRPATHGTGLPEVLYNYRFERQGT